MKKQTVSYATKKTETENGTEETKTVAIEFEGKNNLCQTLCIERTKGLTTISVIKDLQDDHEYLQDTVFQATIEDEKLKQTANYLGEMCFNIGKLALMKFINENMEENT